LRERARVRGISAVKPSFTLTPIPSREREPNVEIFLAFVLGKPNGLNLNLLEESMRKSFRKVPPRALGGIFIPMDALKLFPSQDVMKQLSLVFLL
jgi:hypothetical protein